MRPRVQSREHEQSQGWWRLGGPRCSGEEEENSGPGIGGGAAGVVWGCPSDGGLGSARPAVTPAQRLEDSAALSRWCRLSQWEPSLGRAPLVPALLPAGRDRGSGIGCASCCDVRRGVEEEGPVRFHPTPCLLEGARIAWVRASGWGSDVLFPNPVAAPSRRRRQCHLSHVFPASEPRSAHCQQVQSHCLAQRFSLGRVAEVSSCQDIL